MLRLSKRVEYGLMALMHMDALGPGVLVNAGDMAERYHMPAELLGKVLQALARAGLVESVHGARGGYRLHRSLDTLTVGDVLEAVEGPFRLVKCHEEPCQCDQYDVCTIREPVLAIQQQLVNYLGAFQLAGFRGNKKHNMKVRDV